MEQTMSRGSLISRTSRARGSSSSITSAVLRSIAGAAFSTKKRASGFPPAAARAPVTRPICALQKEASASMADRPIALRASASSGGCG